MSRLDEQLSEQFYRWERRGRGWQVFDHPVIPEPPFRPLRYYLPSTPVVDDGRRPSALSSFMDKLRNKSAPYVPPVVATNSGEEEPKPEGFERSTILELQTTLPAKLSIERETFAQFLRQLSLCREPIAFELLGSADQILAQFVTGEADSPSVRRQLQAYFPDAIFTPKERSLLSAWQGTDEVETAIVEFGLAREFFLPLASGQIDPFIGLTGALAELQAGELGLFQVLFQCAREPWKENVLRAVLGTDGKAFFVNAPELLDYAKEKVSSPLFAAVVRIATRASEFDRAWAIARDLASSLRVFAHPNGNELIPLRNDDYPFEAHEEDVLLRQSRRCGMLLNTDELIGFVHLPTAAVRSSKLARETTKTKPAPKSIREARGLLLGENTHAGQTVEVRLTPDQRTRHTHIIGATGTGKSTLLFNLISEDIRNGEGIAVLDPHGDLIDRILGSIPQNRMDDVILVDPSDENYSVGFNILSVHSDLEKTLLASDLVSVFQRLSTSWGDQMGSVLNNAILAFLESTRGGTLADLRRFLIEPAFRSEFLQTVQDPELIYYWQKGFPQLSGNKSIGPIVTRLEMFLSPKPIRYMVSQRENKLDFATIMDSGKLFLAKLSQGLLGKENSYLLGSLLLSKFQQLAMSRQAQQSTKRRPFFIYADEFQNFITPSMAEILTGARKYGVGLILAHQELRQLERERDVASAVSSCFTRVAFRVGDEDAKKLGDGFASFEARDLQNLETGQAICRVERSDYDFNLSIPCPKEPDEAQAAKRREEVITASKEKYGTPRAEVEAMLRKLFEPVTSDKPLASKILPIPPPKPVTMAKVPEVPRASEIPNVTVSGKEELVVSSVTVDQPRDLGRGGAQHKIIQQRLKTEAEALGFAATIEKEISHGSVDLLLERSLLSIACEISVTTTIDHEVGNIVKCIRAGFSRVAVICQTEERLKRIQAALGSSLGEQASSPVAYFLPDSFIDHLRNLKMPIPAEETAPGETTVFRRGRKVIRKTAILSEEERQQREHVMVKHLADIMKSRPSIA